MSKELTQKRLHEVLNLNTKTGIFTWKIRTTNCIHVGDVAGHKNPDGYIMIGIDGRTYFAHRLAWFYVYGYFPEHGLDHEDRIRHHNWIDNLREASQQCNMRNTGNPKTNTSGVKGVWFYKPTSKWTAEITVTGSKKHLGYYEDFDDAVCARLAGEQYFNWSNCDSSSPAFQYVRKNINRRAI